MEEGKFYHNIRKALEELPENFSILEEQIEIELQMKYFEYAEKYRNQQQAEACFENREELFKTDVNEDRKKEILSSLAMLDEVKAFRTIERFVKEAKGEIRQWAILAMQESRMLLQTSLLDEQQVFISTGLGVKDKSFAIMWFLLAELKTKCFSQVSKNYFVMNLFTT